MLHKHYASHSLLNFSRLFLNIHAYMYPVHWVNSSRSCLLYLDFYMFYSILFCTRISIYWKIYILAFYRRILHTQTTELYCIIVVCWACNRGSIYLPSSLFYSVIAIFECSYAFAWLNVFLFFFLFWFLVLFHFAFNFWYSKIVLASQNTRPFFNIDKSLCALAVCGFGHKKQMCRNIL